MVFWGIEVKSGKPITHSCERARGRLRICQATLGIGVATEKSIVQCNVGDRSPVFICILLPNKRESWHLGLEFQEADDVVFSVIGPRSVHLTGYFHSDTKAKMPWDDKGTQVENEKDELPKNIEHLEEIGDNSEKFLVDDKVDRNKAAAAIINQILPMSNEKDCGQSLDVSSAKPKKKRKNKKPEEKTFETDKDQSVLKEDKAQEVEASMSLDTDANILVPSIEMGSDNHQKSKRRRKLQLTDDEFEQGLTCADSTMMDLPLATEKHQEQPIDNRPANKKIKNKTTKKTQCEEDLNIGMPSVADNQENSDTKCEDQTANGLIIKVVANGPPNGKEAATGKKVKVYYTGMLKESGQVFASNVGLTACNFRLGDEAVIRGWNIGIIGMRVGDKRRLIIPPSMGFGNRAVGEKIPPNSWLVYDIELVGIRR